MKRTWLFLLPAACVVRYQANFREHQVHSEPYTGPTKAEATTTPEAEPAHQGKYFGSKNSDVYHLPGCKDAEKISPSNRVAGRNGRGVIHRAYA